MRGFTLIETIVAIGMFSLLVGIVTSIFITALRAQQQTLAQQEVVQNASFVMEYISRTLRDAQKDLGPTCLNMSPIYLDSTYGTGGGGYTIVPATPAPGWNYQYASKFQQGEWLRFIDRNGNCREFYFRGFVLGSDKTIYERISSTNSSNNFEPIRKLLPDSMALLGHQVWVLDLDPLPGGREAAGLYQGDTSTPDRKQPRIAFGLVFGSSGNPAISIKVSTTVTQRTLDVQK